MSKTGDELMKAANKKAHGIGSKNSKYQAAINLYHQAGQAFKEEKNPISGGEAYSEASKLYEALGNMIEAAKSALLSGKSYVKSAVAKDYAIDNFKRSARLFHIAGQHLQAADVYVQAAKEFHTFRDYESEISCLKSAGQIFADEDRIASSIQYFSQAAALLAETRQWLDAASLYIQVARTPDSEGRVMNSSTTDYYTHAILCQIAAGDVEGANNYLKSYLRLLPGYATLPEGVLIRGLIKAIPKHNVNDVRQVISPFILSHHDNNFYASVLSAIRDSLEDDDGIM